MLNPHRPRILVVDDLRDQTDSMVMLLKLWGYDATGCYNGAAALAAAFAYRPQVVLLDIGMPGMGGLEVAHRLHSRLESAGVVIIGISGYDDPPTRLLARGEGFDHYLLKPMELQPLHELLESIVGPGVEPLAITQEVHGWGRDRAATRALSRRLELVGATSDVGSAQESAP